MIDPQSKSDLDSSIPQVPDQVQPAENVFSEDGQAPAPVEASPETIAAPHRAHAARPPGPGLLESAAWMIGMLAVQIGALVLTVVLIFAKAVLMEEIDIARSGPAELANRLLALLQGQLLAIVGVSQLATIVYGFLAIKLRLRPSGIRRLGWQFPSSFHWPLVALLMPPMWLLSSSLINVLLKWMPWAEDSMKGMLESFAEAPLWLGVLVIGMGPALAEELVFRGLIGRGLVARWGLVPGMLITSILFGVMHVHPVQAMGVIPLGLAMHFAYFTTRSFWAPMTLHLLNNSLSVLWVKLGMEGTRLDKLVEANSDLPLPIFAAAVAMVITIALLLWQTRVRYVLPDGSDWNPGYISTEVPPAEVNAIAAHQKARSLLVAGSVLSTLGFAAALWTFAAG
ncbi:MAG TPA: CPBP family intramembrane glutamic endopeptidase [Planctomycetaceae bacterium]